MIKKLSIALLILIWTPAAWADVKVYDAYRTGGTPGDRILVASTLCPTVRPTPGLLQGSSRLTDDATGTVTMTELLIDVPQLIDIDTTLVFGPGAFIFIDALVSYEPAPGQTGLGGTDPAGSVSWGVISTWSVTGRNFCVSSPVATCNGNGFIHGITTPPPLPSPTYDLGTWSFDTEGDYTATPYVQLTTNGGVANQQFLLRGRFVGASLPALPLVGAGALGLALAAAGLRNLRQQR